MGALPAALRSRGVEAKIGRLEREIESIDAFFYEKDKVGNRDLYASMLERKRDDIVRSTILQIHTSIEDILNSLIRQQMLAGKSTRSKRSRALHKLLIGAGSVGFDAKLNLAIAIGLLNSKEEERLRELNRLRNKCSHNWLLKVPVRRGRRPKQKKLPLLLYRGRDLHNVDVLREFSLEYARIYVKLFLK
jgi:hypothetical protein